MNHSSIMSMLSNPLRVGGDLGDTGVSFVIIYDPKETRPKRRKNNKKEKNGHHRRFFTCGVGLNETEIIPASIKRMRRVRKSKRKKRTARHSL